MEAETPIMQAVVILNAAAARCESDPDVLNGWTRQRIMYLRHAIRHITRPDRDVYPKSRKGTKRRPVTLNNTVQS